jgi:glyoxylase-like metal-dependent hydrolase (beta-lactamase superfamily II)
MQPPDSFDPPFGVARTLAPDLRRILAPNPSAMTFRGTYTYLLGQSDLAVIDPGPLDPSHLEAILTACGPHQRISHIFVTHSHLDHSPLARPLSEATGAKVLAFGTHYDGRSATMQRLAAAGLAGGGEGIDPDFTPDHRLADGEEVTGTGWRLKAIWTPGHIANHLCFAWDDAVFSGDHVMGWSSSLVSPPDGDLTAFMASCRRLQQHPARVFYPGHGAPVDLPAERLSALLAHRQTRETQILGALQRKPSTVPELVTDLYASTPRALHYAAGRNVFAHLIDLYDRQMVTPIPRLADTAKFHLK